MTPRFFAALFVALLGLSMVACNATSTDRVAATATTGAVTPTLEIPATTTSVIDEDHSDLAPVLTWQREGGIAGFCDLLMIYDTGLVEASSCKSDAGNSPLWQAQLSTEALTEFQRWQSTFSNIEQTWADEATADGITERITFVGMGNQPPDEDTLRTMRDFAVKEFITQAP